MHSYRPALQNLLIIFTITLFANLNIYADDPELASKNNPDEYGCSLGILLPGDIYISDSYSDFSKPSSILIKGFYDSYILPDFSTGLFLQYSYSVIEEKNYYDEIFNHNVSIFELGVSIKRRFILNPKWVLKPGLNIGYRKFFFNFTADCDIELNDAHGLGIDASFEVQHYYSSNNIFFGEIGFVSQPFGGKKDITYLEFDPILYFTVGMAF